MDQSIALNIQPCKKHLSHAKRLLIHIDDLVQDCSNTIINALELLVLHLTNSVLIDSDNFQNLKENL